MKKVIAFVWFFIWLLPTLVLLAALIFGIPLLVLLLMGAQLFLKVFIGLLVLLVVGLGIVMVVGVFSRSYHAWVVACIGAYMAPFIVGLTLAAGVFTYPFSTIGLFLLILNAGLMAVSLSSLQYWLSANVRIQYSVDRIVSTSASI